MLGHTGTQGYREEKELKSENMDLNLVSYLACQVVSGGLYIFVHAKAALNFTHTAVTRETLEDPGFSVISFGAFHCTF